MPADPLLGVQPGEAATRMLTGAGIPMAPVRLAADEAQAVAHRGALGRPGALQGESPGITHKTEAGGGALHLDDEAALRAAFHRLRDAASRAMPDARIDGVLVQPMSGGHVELVMGVRRDPVFGIVVMVGSGGILVEVLKDVAFRRAPFSEDEALRMLAELRMAALLDGVRGRPAVDRRAVARMLSRLSEWADRMAPALSELDLNPVLVGPEGPVAVDCVMVFAPQS